MNRILQPSLRARRRTRRLLLVLVVYVSVLASGIFGARTYTYAGFDRLTDVDAIVVLGGAHDGREKYAMELALRGYSDHVVLSNPYRRTDVRMRELCSTEHASFDTTCFVPDPPTTRGEATAVARLASENGWDSVMVISWRYHLLRARYIFEKCFSGAVFVLPVPREYRYSIPRWAYEYLYQTGGFVKETLLGHC
ncbi:YdcF family protein [Rhodococcus sp. W8901]|uniref:YdcF family protein n=1 Tax=Rhodococcus sp. W8901 TaxID=2742603 RepID=UPI001581CAA5|nr:YdcF family protein [Rhodococcus sp. W8901]QKT13219.1 YdcF family protein [Rhodococcus sp. W8901]